jgi:hypothetical protein
MYGLRVWDWLYLEKKVFYGTKNNFSILKCGKEMKMIYKRKYEELKNMLYLIVIFENLFFLSNDLKHL